MHVPLVRRFNIPSATFALVAIVSLTACGDSVPIEDDASVVPTHRSNADIDWRDQVIYQILVDRFYDADDANDTRIDRSSMQRYHGGDFRGIEERLDYLASLGVTALWISPVVENVEENLGSAGFHGYWASDFAHINPHFGTLEELRHFVDAAHARGMLVILDIVTNHIGQDFFVDLDRDGQPSALVTDGGSGHTCLTACAGGASGCSADESAYCAAGANGFADQNEYDPIYDPRGWHSAIDHAARADIEFFDSPELNRRAPPRPPAELHWPDELSWFDDPTWYHLRGKTPGFFSSGSYSRSFVREVETTSDFGGGLMDMATEQPIVQEAFFRIYSYWVEVADFDGFRIDTAKHVDRPDLLQNERGFWGDFAPRMRAFAASIGKQNFFMFGEGFDGNDTLVGAYTRPGIDARGAFGRLDSMLHFANKWRVIDEVIKNGGPTRNVECVLASRFGSMTQGSWCGSHGFPAGPTFHGTAHASPADGGTGVAPNRALVNFVDNHDVPRYLSGGASVESLHNALFYLLTWDGVPCIYYGTEQRFDGGADPANREDMWNGQADALLSPFDMTSSTFAYTRDLIALRRDHIALRRGDISIRWVTDRPRGESDSGILAFERSFAGEKLLVVMNTADGQTSTTCAPASAGGACMPTTFAPNTVLRDIAPGGSNATATVGSNGTLAISVPARTGMVFAPQ